MANLKFIQAQSFLINASGASAGDTTLILQSFKQIDQVTLLSGTSFGDTMYGTLEPNNGTQEEAIQFTGVTQNANGTATLTGVSSVGFIYPYTVTSGLAKSHAGGVTFILSNDAAFYGNIKSYADGLAIAGVANADASTKGAVQIATAAQISAGTATGSTGASIAITPDQLVLSTYGTTLPPSGLISMYGGAAAPTGWVLCDGSSLARAGTYASLFAAISTSYGAADGSHFNVPDLRSRHPVGAGTGTKVFTVSSVSTPTITVTGSTNSATNEIQTGQAVVFGANGGSITTLVDTTTYYLIRVAYNQFNLATTLANAQNGVNMTGLTSLAGSPLFTITMTARSVGDTGGNETHGMSSTELLAHTHNVPGYNSSSAGTNIQANFATGSLQNTATSSIGGNAAMSMMNPFTTVSYIIKI